MYGVTMKINLGNLVTVETECDSITNQGHVIQEDEAIGSISLSTQQSTVRQCIQIGLFDVQRAL